MLRKMMEGALTLLGIWCFAVGAYAATAGGGGGLPWDQPLTTLQTDLSGTTATALSLIGIVAVFGVLIFGGELNHFFRTLCYLILLISVLVAGNTVLTALNITGATVEGGESAYWIWTVLASSAVTFGLVELGHWLHRKYRRQQERQDGSVTRELAR